MIHRKNGPVGRMFRLVRAIDETDISGTGHVASGVVWPDQSVTLKWHTNGSAQANINHYPNLGNMLGIHGHAGKTRVEYVDSSESTTGAFVINFSEFVYSLGHHLEQVEKGIPTRVDEIRKQFGRVLDAVEQLKQRANA